MGQEEISEAEEERHVAATNITASTTPPVTVSDVRTSTSGSTVGKLIRQVSSMSAANRMSSTSSQRSSIIRRTGSTLTTDQEYQLKRTSSALSRGSHRSATVNVSRAEYHSTVKGDLSSKFHGHLVFVAFIVVFGSSFQFGYNISVLNLPLRHLTEFYNSTYNERDGEVTASKLDSLLSLTTALFILGGMIGTLLGGWMADYFGRKVSIMISQPFSVLGAILSTFCVIASAPEMLMIGRIFSGINCGIGNCIAPMMLSEVSPLKYRGAFGTVHQLSITLGILIASVFGIRALLGEASLWPFLILLELIPAILSFIALFFVYDSPRYLMFTKRDRVKAKKSLEFYRETKDVSAEMEEMDTEDQPKDDKPTSWRIFLDRRLMKPLLIACTLQVIQQFSGINAVFFYSSIIFEEAGVSEDNIDYAIICTNAVNVVTTIVSVWLMDKVGRRPLLLIPMLVMAVDLIFLTIFFNLQTSYPWMSYMSIFCVIIYVIGFAIGLGPIPMMIGSELFRQGPRPLAMSAAGIVNWICTFIIAMSFKSVQSAAGSYTFLIFCVLLFASVVFTFFFVPETANRTFEEIAHCFLPGGKVEVEEELEEGQLEVADLGADDNVDHSFVTIDLERHDGKSGNVADITDQGVQLQSMKTITD